MNLLLWLNSVWNRSSDWKGAIWHKSISGRENSNGKGPKAGACPVWLRKSKGENWGFSYSYDNSETSILHLSGWFRVQMRKDPGWRNKSVRCTMEFKPWRRLRLLRELVTSPGLFQWGHGDHSLADTYSRENGRRGSEDSKPRQCSWGVYLSSILIYHHSQSILRTPPIICIS